MTTVLFSFTLALSLALVPLAADAQTNVRVRGTVIGLEGDTLLVKSRDGKDLRLKLADNFTVAGAKAITLADLKSGDYVGVTTTRDNDGKLVAREVHTIARTVPEGHGPWDLEPGSSMTNANIAKTVKATKGHELTLEYKGGSQTVLVPDGVPIVTTVPADRSLLVPGAYVFIAAQAAADGALTALRIQASKDGVKPPQ
jgi:hypothetical protein